MKEVDNVYKMTGVLSGAMMASLDINPIVKGFILDLADGRATVFGIDREELLAEYSPNLEWLLTANQLTAEQLETMHTTINRVSISTRKSKWIEVRVFVTEGEWEFKSPVTRYGMSGMESDNVAVAVAKLRRALIEHVT